jgi:hypothetical protein
LGFGFLAPPPNPQCPNPQSPLINDILIIYEYK